MSDDQIADLIRRVERIERRLEIKDEPQMVLGESPIESDGTVATFERRDTPGGVSPVPRVMPKEALRT
jgi:hypothetical protein